MNGRWERDIIKEDPEEEKKQSKPGSKYSKRSAASQRRTNDESSNQHPGMGDLPQLEIMKASNITDLDQENLVKLLGSSHVDRAYQPLETTDHKQSVVQSVLYEKSQHYVEGELDPDPLRMTDQYQAVT